MDVLAALADNLGTNVAHLPIKAGMELQQVVDLVNAFYLPDSPISYEDYKESQAFLASNEKVTFELIDAATGNVLMTFVNSNSGAAKTVSLNFNLADYWAQDNLGANLLVTEQEFAFLETLPLGLQPIPSVNDAAYQLATLLNKHNYMGLWVSGTFGNLCTAGFELVYLGETPSAPEEFKLEYSAKAAIIRLRNGEQQGYICLRT